MAKQKEDKSGIEILESAEALQQEFNKAESFFDSNKKVLGIIGGAILIIALGIFGYNYWMKQQNAETQTAMFDSVYYFEADSLDLALQGTGGNAGLLEVAEKYGSTAAGNLAKYYVGVAYMKQGKFDDAITYLKDFSSSDLIVQGKTYALIGDAYMEKENAEEAISFYQKAADYNPNKEMTPNYLMKLATAFETSGNTSGAMEAYSELIEKYPTSISVLAATKYKSKLEAEAGN
ncbi:tetratricopeptide repeat protein [Arcticibacterium luteifluviistationis]|uniref:Cytochrome C biosynthesis protein n=1 Tax=Arcticibacterium luteifluviistationis TaxID=1784714 RepID=A0A2Z4GFA7_9BACT|nr:tetratricopeptide repeat protein [Arcticibacterium luteifluviistationis]AWV99725.1 cytochrome C biosynthesis protein [Arcticibacterium luteifluviistationis]